MCDESHTFKFKAEISLHKMQKHEANKNAFSSFYCCCRRRDTLVAATQINKFNNLEMKNGEKGEKI